MDLITLNLSLVLFCATSLRGAGAVLELVGGAGFAVPAWSTGRMWLLRLGYHKLHREKERGADWVWIVDHTMQMGAEKCLVILGIRLAHWHGGDLKHTEVEPIALEPVRQSNGTVVYQQLEAAVKKTGVPRQIISDGGADLQAGIKRFKAVHPDSIFVYDIKHKTALVLKRELSADVRWDEFARYAGQVRKEVQQTSLAALAPPNQRTKARYMNVELLVNWGQRLARFLQRGPGGVAAHFDWAQVEEKFGVVAAYCEALQDWAELLRVVETVETQVREKGLTKTGYADLQAQLSFELRSERGRRVRDELLEHVRQEGSQAQTGERLCGSSEVIESVFGKFKRLEQDQAKSGFTGLLLALAALVSETSEAVVQTCLETVGTKKVSVWCKEKLGLSVQAKRRLAFANETKMVTEFSY